ncbi:MAG TPA: hypothetical protein VIS48_08765 [Candidatus Kryptonia bacterium]
MKTRKSDPIVGIMTDESALAELLEKFLSKEGFSVSLVPNGKPETEEISVMVFAPTREFSKTVNLFEDLKKRVPTLLVLQYDEAGVEADENSIVLEEHPINLKKLGRAVSSLLKRATADLKADKRKSKGEVVEE